MFRKVLKSVVLTLIFLSLCKKNPQLNYVEMDTVIGSIGGKVILTVHFVNVGFMFGILLENKTAAEAANKISLLKSRLAEFSFSFGEIMPVILTDNGGEFSNVLAFENDFNNQKELHIFFCDPNSPYQKPHIENNHTLFRNIVPSGRSFEDFTQDTVDLIFSHVNSVKRKQFNGKSSYELFTFTYSAEFAEALGITSVKSQDVIQSPKLLR